jgi:4a-hydroxytetrahydrobiopterin dehydratase
MTKLLDDAAIDEALGSLPGWTRDGDALRLRVTAPGFPEAITLVDAVAVAAENADHHPDIDIRWRTVTFSLSTHSAGGITDKDIDLAGTIGTLAQHHGASTD